MIESAGPSGAVAVRLRETARWMNILPLSPKEVWYITIPDPARYDTTMDANAPMTTQERAYKSPIWYTP